MVGDDKLEVVPEFRYLNDMLSAWNGCKLAVVTHCKRVCEASSPTSPTSAFSHQPPTAYGVLAGDSLHFHCAHNT